MNHLLNNLSQQLTDSFFEKASATVGSNKEHTKAAFEKGLPFLIGALAKNTKTQDGAESLNKAITKKHNGSVFDHLDDLVAHPENGEGAGILKHLLGSKEVKVEEFLGKKTELSQGGSKKVLQILAPMILGALGQEKKESQLNSDQLGKLLQSSAKNLKGKSKSIPMSLVMGYLDKDGDGDIKDDLFTMVMARLRG